MNNDRELLEAAAKAAGVGYCDGEELYGGLILPGGKAWNPLTDDGDALRLAVKLGFIVNCWREAGKVWAGLDNDLGFIEPLEDDPYAATRRAIVRASAEIGKGMK